MAELIIHSGKLTGRRLVLPERELIVGRDEECHLRLASSLVSRKHCELKVVGEGIWVRDLGSQNGTYVNDVAVTEPLLLKSGDVLRIGANLFQVPEGKPQAARPVIKKDDSKISDADIADWLSDDDHPAVPKGTDTAVIEFSKPAPVVSSPVPSAPPPPVAPTPPAAKKPYRSVKDEAAEIIRRHWESVRAAKGE